MGIKLDIDLKNKYEITRPSGDLRVCYFDTILKNGATVPLRVMISNKPHELLPNVFNLAFGPLNAKGQIDDKAELSHKNYSKTFSTIILSGLHYLSHNPDHFLGVDGSSDGRAFLYYRVIQRNFDYLDKYFNMFGLKYYVRVTRFGKTQYDDPFDFRDIAPQLVRLEKGTKIPAEMMYNYFVFNLK